MGNELCRAVRGTPVLSKKGSPCLDLKNIINLILKYMGVYIIQKHTDPAIKSLSISSREIEDMCYGQMTRREAIWHPNFPPYERWITLGDEAAEYFRKIYKKS